MQSGGAYAMWAELVGGWQKRTLPIVTKLSARGRSFTELHLWLELVPRLYVWL